MRFRMGLGKGRVSLVWQCKVETHHWGGERYVYVRNQKTHRSILVASSCLCRIDRVRIVSVMVYPSPAIGKKLS